MAKFLITSKQWNGSSGLSAQAATAREALNRYRITAKTEHHVVVDDASGRRIEIDALIQMAAKED